MKKFLLICISVMTFFLMSVTSFASSETGFVCPSGKDFVVFENSLSKRYACTIPKESGAFFHLSGGSILTVSTPTAGTVVDIYKLDDGEWSIDKSLVFDTGGALGYSNLTFLDSSVPIYKAPDKLEVVFHHPTLEEVTQESLVEMKMNLGQVASIVVLCGVGCLALLIGCHLLRKKSVLFLNR